MNVFNKLFRSPYFFTIAIRKKKGSILDDLNFQADYVMPSTRLHWVADPILVEDGKKTYLFYEAFHKTKGRLEVVEINDDCTTSKPTVILEDNTHYSYPYVFRYKEEWYMIPESSEQNTVSLYKAVQFPQKWIKVKDLLHDKAVDSTAFQLNHNWYMLTFVIHEGTEKVTPKAFRIIDTVDSIELKPMHWKNYQELECRGAGSVFKDKEDLIRPAQVSLEDRYGDYVCFYKVSCHEDEYSEEIVSRLKPENVKAKNWWIDGLHTYACSSQFEVIDLRCRKFDLLKVPRALFKTIFKH